MIANINTNVFKLFTIGGEHKTQFMDMTQEFAELGDILRRVLNKWDEAQTRNEALLSSTEESADFLKAMAETLIFCAEKAKENHP